MAEDNFIRREVSRCNRNLFIINVLLTLFVSFIFSAVFYETDIAGQITAGALFFAIPALNYCKLYSRLSNWEKHPLYKRFKRFKDPEASSKRLSEDIKKNVLFKNRFNTITKNWIIKSTTLDTRVIHKSEICWVHIHRIRQSINFVPVGSYWFVRIFDIYKKMNELSFGISKGNAEQAIKTISQIAPWAVYGWNPELAGLWAGKPELFIQRACKKQAPARSTKNAPTSKKASRKK